MIHADELDFLIKDNGRLERMTGLFARLAEDFALPVVLVNKLATRQTIASWPMHAKILYLFVTPLLAEGRCFTIVVRRLKDEYFASVLDFELLQFLNQLLLRFWIGLEHLYSGR